MRLSIETSKKAFILLKSPKSRVSRMVIPAKISSLQMSESDIPLETPLLQQINLKTGDYRVHVYIQEGRAFLPPKGGDTTDPIISIKAFNQTKSSDPIQDIGSSSTIYWGEHFFFQKKNAIHQDLQDDKITIRVLDHNTLFKNSLVGVYQLDLIYIYTQPNHAILHTWIVLSNPKDENFDQMRGYLKVGVSVLHHDDPAVDLSTKQKVTARDKDLLLPPHVKPQVVQLVVHLLKAENLPMMDKGQTVDAYGIAKFGGAQCRSSVIQADAATFSVYWYQEMFIPVMLPCVTNTFSMVFWDKDLLSSDQLIGSFNLNFSDIKKGKYKNFFWANIYGAQALLQNEQAEIMNTISEAASCWRGRVLLRAWVVDDGKTVFKKVRKIKQENIENLVRDQFEIGAQYEIRAMAFSATALPISKAEYSLEISWSGVNLTTSLARTNNGNVDWYQNLKRMTALIPSEAEKVLPDVFVYLVYKQKRICYARLRPEDLMDVNSQGMWVSLIADKAVGEVKQDWKSGFVKVRVYIGIFDQDEDDLRTGSWKGTIKKPPMQSWVLLNHIYQCADLPSSDRNGLADPYIKIYCGGNEISTEKYPKESTLNPKWYQTLALPIKIPDIGDAPPVIIYIYDYDLMGANDIMGVVVVTLDEASTNIDTPPQPIWYNLGLRNSVSQGKILASFTLCKPGRVPKIDITPQFVDKTVEINILGMRDLKPAVGWLPVNKAFVKIDLNSLDLPDSSSGIELIQTQPFESGNNPNVNTCLSFRCKIPKDPIFAPTVTCQVCDYLFSGLSQPLIGTFAINLGDFMDNSQMKRRLKLSKRTKGVQEVFTQKKAHLSSEQDIIFQQQKKQDQPVREKRKNNIFSIQEAAIQQKIKLMPRFTNRGGIIKQFDFPNPEQYISIGWNRTAQDGLKQYRFFINNQYEKSQLASQPAFDIFRLIKGQNRGVSQSLFRDYSSLDRTGAKSTVKTTGKLKAKIRVSPYPHFRRPMSMLKEAIIKNMTGEQEFDDISRALLDKRPCVVRVYIIDAFDLEQKDRKSHSDPYLRVKLGKQIQQFEKQYQQDTPNPSINKMCQFQADLPGVTVLKVQLWDFNKIFPNEKIGTTKIDLQDRFFSHNWRSLHQKPVQTRPLFHGASRVPQGYIRLWVDIFQQGEIPEPVDISPKPPAVFQARLIIWKCKEVASQDFQDVSDLFLRAYLHPHQDKETDTHYRAQKGKGSWNWRMKFPIKLPTESNLLTIQLWDRDILSPNDWVGEITLPFNQLAEEAFESNLRTKMKGESDELEEKLMNKLSEIFWVDMTKRNSEGEFQNVGKVMISFQLVPEHRALACPVGEGRESPNVDPYLPPPIGRFQWSWNPLRMINQLCGPEFKAKILCAICCIICLLMAIFIFPSFCSSLIANSVTD